MAHYFTSAISTVLASQYLENIAQHTIDNRHVVYGKLEYRQYLEGVYEHDQLHYRVVPLHACSNVLNKQKAKYIDQ